ncbi:hypothetical protein JXK06_03250 [Patescibacteria group bacterium]|nr:hypothetical protein [Patescibacteria group bacterium]
MNNFKKLFFVLSFSFVFTLVAAPVVVLAQEGSGTNTLPSGTGSNPTTASNDLSLSNPLGASSVNELIGRVINSVMGIVGSLALLMFVYGGLTWMTSSGSQDKVKKGKDILLWSAIGLIVIFGAYGLTKFIINLAT